MIRLRKFLIGFVIFILIIELISYNIATGYDNPLAVFFKPQVPPGEWANTNNCGQTSALMVMCYHKGTAPTEQDIKDIDDWLFKKYGDPINNYNGSVTNITKIETLVKEYSGFTNSYKDSGWGLTNLKQQIDGGLPVITAITAGHLSNRGYNYAGGHFVVVIGYTDTHIICNDPGTSLGVEKYYSNDEFSEAFSSQNGSVVVVVPNQLSLPNQSIVKSSDPNEPDIYWFQNEKLYKITGPSVIDKMSTLKGWSNVLKYPSETFNSQILNKYPKGPSFITTDSSSNGLLIRLQGDDKVYLIENGKRNYLTLEEFNSRGLSGKDVIDVTKDIFELFANTSPNQPSLSLPLNNVTSIDPNNTTFSWSGSDPDGDNLRYWITINEDSEPNDIPVINHLHMYVVKRILCDVLGVCYMIYEV